MGKPVAQTFLEVVSLSEEREVLPLTAPMKRGVKKHVRELAVGFTKCQAFLRAPSGRLFVLRIPSELYDELAKIPPA